MTVNHSQARSPLHLEALGGLCGRLDISSTMLASPNKIAGVVVTILTSFRLYGPLSLACHILFATTATSLILDLLILAFILNERSETTYTINTLLQEKRDLQEQLKRATLETQSPKRQPSSKNRSRSRESKKEQEQASQPERRIATDLSECASRPASGEHADSDAHAPVSAAQPQQDRNLIASTSPCIVTAKYEGAASLDRNIKSHRKETTPGGRLKRAYRTLTSAASDGLLSGTGKKIVESENEGGALTAQGRGDIGSSEVRIEDIIRERVLRKMDIAFKVCRGRGEFDFELRRDFLCEVFREEMCLKGLWEKMEERL